MESGRVQAAAARMIMRKRLQVLEQLFPDVRKNLHIFAAKF